MTTSAEPGRIVVGVDGSTEASHALAWAHSEAALRGADLDVVHAWAPPIPVSEASVMVPVQRDEVYEQAATELVEALVSGLAAHASRPRSVRARAVRGHPSMVLLDAARGADALVVGSRGHGGFMGLLLGSVSHQCVHHATGPVFVVPADAPLPGSGEVVVGVDGSPAAQHALHWAVDEAARRGARLVAVHAWATPYAVPPGGIGLVPLHEQDFLEQSRQLLSEVVDRAVSAAGQPPASVQLVVEESYPAPALLARARTAGLLVVGDRGRGGFAGLVIGSVSQQVLHHATSAVAVIPNPERAAADEGG